ncbi:MAG: hypothetical protein RBT71_02110 [Flavobacteriales bacterium]|jgi:hypothetical protein|nr:hypothetical protein [Flavobacteriales bacterium]
MPRIAHSRGRTAWDRPDQGPANAARSVYQRPSRAWRRYQARVRRTIRFPRHYNKATNR